MFHGFATSSLTYIRPLIIASSWGKRGHPDLIRVHASSALSRQVEASNRLAPRILLAHLPKFNRDT